MRAGLTQEDVLRETGIHVARIEMGRNSCNVSTFFRLCVFLDVDVQKITCQLQKGKKKLTVL
jgi:transcriptional regulator with XRE-family HTH domain